MGAHSSVFELLTQKLIAARDPLVIDELLDRWIDLRMRASEWDAQQWGFDLDSWMRAERAEMAKRLSSSRAAKTKK